MDTKYDQRLAQGFRNQSKESESAWSCENILTSRHQPEIEFDGVDIGAI